MSTARHPDDRPAGAPAPDAELKALRDLIAGERVAMLTVAGEDGLLQSRPMTVLDHDAHGAFWFFCDCAPGDERFRARHRDANLAFTRPSDSVWVSLSGHGEVLHDPERNRRLWTPMARPWFPEGPESPRLALLKFSPVRGETWEGPGNAVTRLFAAVASVAAGRPVAMGEHAVLHDLGDARPAPTER